MLKTLSVVGFLLMIAGMLGLLATRSLLSPAPVVIAVQLAAVGLMIWARTTFGMRSFHASADPTAGGLVTTGPYRFVRHPIYTAVCLFAFAGALVAFAAGRTGSPLCEPGSTFQWHGVWHVLGAIAIGAYAIATGFARSAKLSPT